MRNKGFTLIELVVVLGILSALIVFAVTLIDPIRQIDKARDSQKKQDFEQIKTAMDLYYDDNKCYPTSLSFGYSWSSDNGQVVYMSKIPQSPDSATPYSYLTDGLCPQWYAIYSKSSVNGGLISASNPTVCPLDSEVGCAPDNNQVAHICVYGGIVNCSYISNNLSQ